MKTKARKFIDKDVVGFAAFDNGVVLKVNQNDVCEAIDDDGVAAVYLYLDELNFLMDEVYTNSPDEPAPEYLSAPYQQFIDTQFKEGSKVFCTNSAVPEQALVLLDGDSVSDCPIAKRNRAFVYISLETLHKVQKTLISSIEKKEQAKAFDKAFQDATGCKIVIAKDSNKRMLQRVV
ncbi:MAG: hypothetical protein CMN72_00360 [Sphingomonas sp.]|nr:hypothetical protein [Sphingomonas sp.]|tara:strand:- start:189 stop:719 length:531 start_codon:yes stop_codon:yes gene_type:complete